MCCDGLALHGRAMAKLCGDQFRDAKAKHSKDQVGTAAQRRRSAQISSAMARGCKDE